MKIAWTQFTPVNALIGGMLLYDFVIAKPRS